MRSPPSLVVLALTHLACGGATPPPGAIDPSEQREAAPLDTLAVSGLRGTLSQQEIQGALEPRLPKFLRCVQRRLPELELLSGTLSFSFHVAVDGRVVAVTPSASTLGDRATERCMLEVAEATRFPPPHGGEADLTWPLEVPLDEALRAPVELEAELVRTLVAQEGQALHARCGGGAVVVTVYVDPEGQVLAAGAAAPDLSTGSQLDCITDGVRSWRFGSPGSYIGKGSFPLP